MSRDIQLKERWEKVVAFLSEKFADGEGTKLDKVIDSDAANPATRGD